MVLCYRTVDSDRFAMLEATVERLATSLAGSGLQLLVGDASDEPWFTRGAALWRHSKLNVEHQRLVEPLAGGIGALLRQIDHRFFYLQFDDVLTVGLSSPLLEGACRVLATSGGDVGAVCTLWPMAVREVAETQTLLVTGVELRSRDGAIASCRFGMGQAQRPVVQQRHGDLIFGSFENFVYGFFFNNVVCEREDYLSRLDWYLDNVSPSAHQIELATASRHVGPFWTHLGLPLDGQSLLDLDYKHTSTAVRGELPQNRRAFDLAKAGWRIEHQVRPR